MKKKFIFVILLLFFVLHIFLPDFYKLMFIFKRDISLSRRASLYENVENRLDYFYRNKNDLNVILDFMNNNKIIEKIVRYSICPLTSHKYEFEHNYILCSIEELSDDTIKYIDNNIIEKLYNIKLEAIYLVKSRDEIPVEYSFRLVSTFLHNVQYVYCLDHSKCTPEAAYEEFFIEDGFIEGFKIKNQIDDNWYTSYHSIPPL